MSSTNLSEDCENQIDPDVDVYLSQICEKDLDQARFNQLTTADEIENIINEVKPRNTIKQELWAVKIWSSWASTRLSSSSTSSNCRSIPINLSNNSYIDFEDFEYWLPYFVMEVRNKDGEEYSPNSIKQIMTNLFRYLKDNCHYPGLSFVDRKSPFFKIIEARMKKMRINGLGLQLKKADVVTADDEEKLWATKVINMDTSSGLFAAVFFYTGKTLALRGREEHRKLNIEQFELKTDSQGVDFLHFWPKYLEHLPEKKGPFYRRPIDHESKIAFSTAPVGINTLAKMLKTLFIKADIDISSRQISNHGLRATAVTDLIKSGFETAVIKKRTGHRSDAIDAYFRSDTTSHKSTSLALDPPLELSSTEINNKNTNVNHVEPNEIAKVSTESVSSVSSVNDNDKVKDEDKEISLNLRLGNKKIKIDISL
ncbi:uncharacterized protein LOC107370688 [Tetranychus urticae]|uniref:uncharacterized protein LOC107370688 n=1 Tax=Tetranychus urticae TaxID=32264 RepID=UPI00077BEE44|nr:uncharacterized protein LOC107370688 [Tetranychus urticae]